MQLNGEKSAPSSDSDSEPSKEAPGSPLYTSHTSSSGTLCRLPASTQVVQHRLRGLCSPDCFRKSVASKIRQIPIKDLVQLIQCQTALTDTFESNSASGTAAYWMNGACSERVATRRARHRHSACQAATHQTAAQNGCRCPPQLPCLPAPPPACAAETGQHLLPICVLI